MHGIVVMEQKAQLSEALDNAVQWLEQIRDCAELASGRDLGEMAEAALNEIDKLRNKST